MSSGNPHKQQKPPRQKGSNRQIEKTYQLPRSKQYSSTFFTKFTHSIRTQIYIHALSTRWQRGSTLSDSRPWKPDQSTFYNPGPSKSEQHFSSALLQTCQRINSEARLIPWLTQQFNIFLSPSDRPSEQGVLDTEALLKRLDMIASTLGSQYAFIRATIRIYIKPNSASSLSSLQALLNHKRFKPHHIILSIRHFDFAGHHIDTPLSLPCTLPNATSFPASVKEIRLELETLARKSDQLTALSTEITKSWSFTGKYEYWALPTVNVDTWTGLSVFAHDKLRWVRDETSSGRVKYEIHTLTFRAFKNKPRYIAPDITITAPSLPARDLDSLPVDGLLERHIQWDSWAVVAARDLARFSTPCRCRALGKDCCATIWKAWGTETTYYLPGDGWVDPVDGPSEIFCRHCWDDLTCNLTDREWKRWRKGKLK